MPSVFIMLVTFGVSDGCVQMYKLLMLKIVYYSFNT